MVAPPAPAGLPPSVPAHGPCSATADAIFFCFSDPLSSASPSQLPLVSAAGPSPFVLASASSALASSACDLWLRRRDRASTCQLASRPSAPPPPTHASSFAESSAVAADAFVFLRRSAPPLALRASPFLPHTPSPSSTSSSSSSVVDPSDASFASVLAGESQPKASSTTAKSESSACAGSLSISSR